MAKYIRKKLCAILTGGGLSALIWSLIFLPVQTIFITPASAAVLPPATSGDFASVPLISQISASANVLIILDNSNSMDNDVDGNPVGSTKANSRSEIERNAMKTVIAKYQASMRFGLMAYNQANLSPTWYNPAYFGVAYCKNCTNSANDGMTRNLSAPVDPNNAAAGTLYYAQGWSGGGYVGPAGLYCYYRNGTSYPSDCGLNPCTAYPFYCCSQKTVGPRTLIETTPPNQSLASLQSNYGYGGTCTQSDFITLEGTRANVQTGAPQSPWGQEMAFLPGVGAWTAGITPGDGLLHVDIGNSTSQQITNLNSKLATEDFTNVPQTATTAIRNAGDTPIPGALQTALRYFQGQPQNVAAIPGVTAHNPILASCQKNYVILVTDGLPTTMPDGSLGTPAQLLDASVAQVKALRSVTNAGNPGGSDGNGKPFDVKTFVVGFAMAGSASTLSALAQAGGTGTVYDASDEQALNSALATIFQQISQDATSGTVPTINTNSRSGEGGIFPAAFYPQLQDLDGRAIPWAGDVTALFVDKSGRLREDTNSNWILDDTTDKIITYNKNGIGFATPVGALTEINILKMPAASALLGSSAASSKYFFINAASGHRYYVCFNVDGIVIADSSINSLNGVYRQRLEVQLTATDDAAAVASNTARVLANSMAFQATATGAQLTVETILPGSVEHMNAAGNSVTSGGNSVVAGIDTGITITNTQTGSEPSSTNATTGSRSDIHYLWSASNWLAAIADVTTQRDYSSTAKGRHIITFTGDNSGIPTNAAATPAFAVPADPTAPLANLIPVSEKTSGPISITGASVSTVSQSDMQKMTTRVINFIRGQDQGALTLTSGATLPAFRSRQIKYNNDTQPRTWRLGDIIHSNPLVVERPNQGYKSIYGDTGYAAFMAKYANRRTMIYVGANDGMLHAFNGGFYENRYSADLSSTNNPVMRYLQQPVKQPVEWQNTKAVIDTTNFTKYDLGAELWAYVPYNLLGHLYWLTEASSGTNAVVNHVYYVDLTPVAYDVQMFPVDDDHPNGWGTILVGGMGFGGGRIDTCYGRGSNGDCANTRSMSSAYFIFDITNPEKEPKLLAEFALPHQGYTTDIPALAYFKDTTNPSINQFFLVFGSGPANAAGQADSAALQSARSSQNARLFYLRLPSLGQPLNSAASWGVPGNGQLAQCGTDSSQECSMQIVGGAPAYVSDMVTTDIDLDYKIDAFYYGTVVSQTPPTGGSLSLSGALRRVLTNASSDPNNWTTDSTLIDLAAAGLKQPISAAPSTAFDSNGNLFVYFGTGRYLTTDDRSNSDQQALYGIKEPRDSNNKFTWATVNYASLYNSTDIKVSTADPNDPNHVEVKGGMGTNISWQNFLSYMGDFPGWVYNLRPEERAVNQPAVTDQLFLATTFMPSNAAADVCNNQGQGYLYAFYYLTGTQAMTKNGPTTSLTSVGAGLPGAITVNGTTANIYSSAGVQTSVQLVTEPILGNEPTGGPHRVNWGIISE